MEAVTWTESGGWHPLKEKKKAQKYSFCYKRKERKIAKVIKDLITKCDKSKKKYDENMTWYS